MYIKEGLLKTFKVPTTQLTTAVYMVFFQLFNAIIAASADRDQPDSPNNNQFRRHRSMHERSKYNIMYFTDILSNLSYLKVCCHLSYYALSLL